MRTPPHKYNKEEEFNVMNYRIRGMVRWITDQNKFNL